MAKAGEMIFIVVCGAPDEVFEYTSGKTLAPGHEMALDDSLPCHLTGSPGYECEHCPFRRSAKIFLKSGAAIVDLGIFAIRERS